MAERSVCKSGRIVGLVRSLANIHELWIAAYEKTAVVSSPSGKSEPDAVFE